MTTKKKAATVEASGAINDIGKIDTDHPAVDDTPRSSAPAASNNIDLNDPTLSQTEAVSKALREG